MKKLHCIFSSWAICVVALAVPALAANVAACCPFCSVTSQTLSEESRAADAVVLAKLVKEADAAGPTGDKLGTASANSGTATFEIMEVIRGENFVKSGQPIDVVYFGPSDREQVFMITGISGDKMDWITPLPLSAAGIDYVRKLPSIPASGADRLAFFQDYLEHPDPLLGQDAYDEFGRAPYNDLHDLKPRIYHDKLVKWILDPEVPPARRRLYFTMLGVCGSEADVPMLESLIVSNYATKQPFAEQLVRTGLSLGGPVGLPALAELAKLDERRKKLGLDALVACYLTLRGGDGLDLIDEQFLKKPGVEYTHIYSTVMALRFHGDEPTSKVPKQRLLASMRLLLDNPDFADQVPIDLSRWGDWSVLDRLVEMYKRADKNGYIRQPVVSYLTVASEEPGDVGARAKAALADLEKLDPEGVKQARSLAAFGSLARARAGNGVADTPATTDVTVSQGGAADPTGGFGASASDVAAESDTPASKIPDPTEFSGEEEGKVEQKGEAAKPQAAVVSVGSAPAEVPAARTHAEWPLVVGLPLVAAAALMGVYWVILRFGAV